MTEQYDAIVIGGGPAGSAAAVLLARAGWSIALLERKDFPRRKVCGEYLSATNLPLLDRLGIGDAFDEQAGPPVTKVGLFAGDSVVTAELPRPRGCHGAGRALSRERLDTLLLDTARRAGATVLQPWSVESFVDEGHGFRCSARSRENGATADLQSDIIISAHGSWESGNLPTQSRRRASRPDDLFGFKAHFVDANLPAGQMPLLAFPGGYGGMVETDGDRVSLSCCVRRDRLAILRAADEHDAGAVVLHHIRRSCRGTQDVLKEATLDGPWLGAGPIRPGIRLQQRRGVFPVGNVAGEAHPVVAEGISMALQGAWLLCERLLAWARAGRPRSGLIRTHRDYAADWRRHFAARLHVAAAIAHWAMRPHIVAGTLPVLRRWPQLLNWGARLSGKDAGLGISSQESELLTDS